MLILSDHEILFNIQYVAYLPINLVTATKDITQMSALINKTRTSFTPSLQLQHLHLTTI